MKPIVPVLAMLALIASSAAAAPVADQPPLLLQNPTLSRTQIAFNYGDDIWLVDRDGGEATRLIAGPGHSTGPFFSPDGTLVAYTGNYDENTDVYVVSAQGGQPTRLTYHPGPDVVVGWTPDGKSVLFRSHRESPTDPDRLFTVSLAGGLPHELPLAMAERGSYSPDGRRLAYVPVFQWEPFWKQYRGGQTTPIWIADLSNSRIVKVPRENSNDNFPMWVGDTIFFLSDRNGPKTLFAYNLGSQQVSQVVPNDGGFDVTSASAGPGAIVYVQFDSLHLFDLKTGAVSTVNVVVRGDMPQLRPHFK
jgi:tricorn protease